MIESLILAGLIYKEGYGRKVVPFLQAEYFHDRNDKKIFNAIKEYINKYNSFPNKVALSVALSESDNVNEEDWKVLKDKIDQTVEPTVEEQWLIDKTEKFCKDKAIYNAISASIKILDDKNSDNGPGSIPKLLEEALAVSFDTHIGHDFFDNALERYEFYHRKEQKIEFDIDYLNKITKGGLSRKTLNVILAGTGVGKSLFMCHTAASNIVSGKNVLYITLEMAEERIAERIDANLMNLTLDDLKILPRETYEKKIARVREKATGKLIIKEYPTSSAGVSHFRHLLNELRLKKKFIPDIIYVDYLNICASSRYKHGANINSYTYVKAIAEELRGLAVEHNVPIVSATQTTRSGFTNADLGLEDTSESFGLPATVDLMLALISTDELEDLNQLMVKQLKNRYADPSSMKRFVVGVDRARMKLYDVEIAAQQDIVEDTPVFDRSKLTKDVFKGFS